MKTKEPILPKDVQSLLDELFTRPPASPPRSVQDYISQEPEELTPPGENPAVQAFLTALTWIMFAVSLGSLVWLILATSEGIQTYLGR